MFDAFSELYECATLIMYMKLTPEWDSKVYSDLIQEIGPKVALFPGHSQILSRSHVEKSGEGLGTFLCHGPEMVDLVIANRVHITY